MKITQSENDTTDIQLAIDIEAAGHSVMSLSIGGRTYLATELSSQDLLDRYFRHAEPVPVLSAEILEWNRKVDERKALKRHRKGKP